MDYKNMIKTTDGFQTSINILYDLNDFNKVKRYIPTNVGIEIIEEIILSTADNATDRAKILTGAYGKGKSHIILVALAILNCKEKKIFKKLLDKIKEINFDLYEYINEYLKSDKKLLPVIIEGNSDSLSQSFLTAMETTLYRNNLKDIMPRTNYTAAIETIDSWKINYVETYKSFENKINTNSKEFVKNLESFDKNTYLEFLKIYPTLTSGSVFNPYVNGDVVDLYEEVNKELKKKGYTGMYIVYDEFSKYLESNINSVSKVDIKLLQDMAEKCNRSQNQQMHLLLISHKEISNYIDESSDKSILDAWRGVSGRFSNIELNNNFEQIYDVISQVIIKDEKIWGNFQIEYNDLFNEISLLNNDTKFLGYNSEEEIKKIIKDSYPLHPISMFLLPRLSEKIAQNERTLFTFLSSREKYTLNDFLTKRDKEFELLTPDYIYDYFEPLFRKESYISPIYKIYKLTNNILIKLSDAENDLYSKIIKSISLIYMVEQYEKIAPKIDTILDIYCINNYSREEVEKIILNLIDIEALIYQKKSNNFLQLKDRTGVDVKNEIQKRVSKIEIEKSSIDILNEINSENYIYPARYNDENEIVRYFDFRFISSDLISDIEDLSKIKERFTDLKGDGLILGIIPTSKKSLERIKEECLSEKCAKNIVFILPKTNIKNIGKNIYEYMALLELKNIYHENKLLLEEYEVYLEDLREVILKYISNYIRPEKGQSLYIVNQKNEKLNRKSQLSNILSDICEVKYDKTPVIVNEIINKNELSTTTLNSRSRIINGFFETENDINFGVENSNQDMSILRSVILRNEILIKNEFEIVELNENIKDFKFAGVIKEIDEFIINSKGDSFEKLYIKLIDEKYGYALKRGVIPILLSSVIYKYKDSIIITKYGKEVKLSANMINELDKNPEFFKVSVEDWTKDKVDYTCQLEKIFGEYIFENEKKYNNFNYILDGMNRWYMNLPKITKDIDQIYNGQDKATTKIKKNQIKFRNKLKKLDNNPREFILEDIFTIFELKKLDLDIIKELNDTKTMYDNLLKNLVGVIIEDIKNIFGKTKEGSLRSIVLDWIDTLEKETLNHLYKLGEERILVEFINITNDEELFISEISKKLTGLRIEDWNSMTIDLFMENIINFKKTIEENNNKIKNKDDNNNINIYKFIFINQDGKEIVRTFEKCDKTKRANLLRNEINSAIDEMGRSISDSEKRQVILDVLEELS